jgi:predicted HTH transcriptional regulator
MYKMLSLNYTIYNDELFEESTKLEYASLVLFGKNILKHLKDHEICIVLFKEW